MAAGGATLSRDLPPFLLAPLRGVFGRRWKFHQ